MIATNICQVVFFTLAIFYSIKDDSQDPLIPGIVLLIPEGISLLCVIFFSRWPDNPCQSLQHLVKCSAQTLKSCLVFFIILKLDGSIAWTWTATLWPYWCAFAVHLIFVVFIACLFLYSLICFLKGEFSWQCCKLRNNY